jgi:cytochrome c oxidase subunit 2
MGDKGTFWLPESASTVSGEVDALFYLVLWISVVIFVSVVAAMAYFVLKYRRQRESDVPATVGESRLFELSTIMISTVLCLIVFTWGFKVYLRLNVSPPGAYEIQVTASQWKWDFTYPDGTVYAGELHVPANRPVRLVMSSMDVLHSFFVPQFRVKQDVLPNRYTSVWFEAATADTFDVYCTEYCGNQHSGMLAKVVAQPQAEFDAWLSQAGGGDLSPAEYGARLFTQNNCNTCHSIDGTRVIGPTMKGLFESQRPLESGATVVADENYLLNAIVAPSSQVVQTYPPAMPASYAALPQDQLNALVAYIKSLE